MALKGPELPDRLRSRPIAKGYPVPWFVQCVDGVPDFRLIDQEKVVRALRFKKCLICGDELGRAVTFASGPIAAITRVAPEPPAHHDCAEYAAQVCPHMTLPKAKRRPVPGAVFPGHHFTDNPGVWVLWTTESYLPVRVPSGIFFRLGEPTRLDWFCEGRTATPEEIREAITSVEPALRELAKKDGQMQYFETALTWLHGRIGDKQC